MRLPNTDALLFRAYLVGTIGMLAVTSLWAAVGPAELSGVLAGAWYTIAGFGVTFMLWLAIGHARDHESESLWLAFRESAE